jgi:glycosyltransferase involved in cell wall biosynthesis
VRTIPLGFDLSRFCHIDSAPEESIGKAANRQYSQPLRIGTIGRLTAVKNHFMLLETINCLRLSDKIDNFKFIIIGDGELKKDFMDKANELNLMNAIVFKGWQKDMPSVYAQLDAVVLTSKNEGTPVALIEAMASCRPVVATAVGGVPDLLGRVKEKKPGGFRIAERGLMTQSGDAEALARAILYLSENRGTMQPMIRKAKEFVLTNYGQDRLLNDIKMLYGELLGL